MRNIFQLICYCCLFGMSCSSNSKKLVWSDEFDHPGQPDTTNWNYELGDGCPNCGWGNNEEQIYTDGQENVRIENGFLIVEAIKLDSQWTSARITTKNKMHFTYGLIEFRAKLSKGVGTWPALWMLGENIDAEGWPACGEIDVMEFAGRNPGVVQSALHSPSSYGNTMNLKETTGDTFASEFHTYSVNWTKERIEFFVDEKKFYSYQPAIQDENTWPFNDPFFILINLAMGGNFGDAIAPELSTARMEVDYVRVYR